jgi:NAD(P)-dependent dehydrogenase (short-subunit alcohol dehydrogenase family)
MKDFAGRIAVVTGGGSGMGRELVRQLVAEACNVAMCDVSAPAMAATQRLCEAAGAPQGLRVTAHIGDVSDAAQVAGRLAGWEGGLVSGVMLRS